MSISERSRDGDVLVSDKEIIEERTAVHTPAANDDPEKQIKEKSSSPIEIPDGGLQAWATVFGA